MPPKKAAASADKPATRPRSARVAKAEAEKEKKARAAARQERAAAAKTKAGVKKQTKTTTRKAATKAQPKRAKSVKKETKKKRAAPTKKAAAAAAPAKKSRSSAASKEKVAEGRVDTILEQLPLSILHEMCGEVRVATAQTKRQCADNVIAWCSNVGERHLIDSLEKEVLKSVVKAVEGPVSHDNKGKLQASLRKALSERGQEAVFGKLNEKMLDQLTKVFDFEEEGGKADKMSALMQEIVLWGALQAFDRMKSAWVGDVAAMFGIPKSSKGSTKATTIKKILGLAFPHLADEAAEEEERRAKGLPDPAEEEEEKEEEEAPVEKKPIAKGVTLIDLYQYYVGELVDYCKKNKLKVSGSKREVARRILAFLDGDVEGTKALTPAEIAQRKRERAEKRKAGSVSAGKAKKKQKKK